MKKLVLNLFVISSLIVSTSCSKSDDDGGDNPGANELKITIDGTVTTFNSIIVDDNSEPDGNGYYDVTATVNNETERIISFFVYQDDTGANALSNFTYTRNGIIYYSDFGAQFNSVVSVNNGNKISATFSGTLNGYNQVTEMEESLTITNGSITVNF